MCFLSTTSLMSCILFLLLYCNSIESQNIQECCHYLHSNSSNLLYECIHRINNHSLDSSNTNNKLYNIIFVTFISKEIYSYSLPNILNQILYLQSRNIRMHILSEDTGDDYYPIDRRWNKINAIYNGFDTWAMNYTYIIYIDTDLIFINWNFNIFDIVHEYSQAEIILSMDMIDLANTGIMIIKNSLWSKMFYNQWWLLRILKNTYCDQHVLNRLIHNVSLEDKHKIAIIPFKIMNSKWPAIENFEVTDSILHLMGETTLTRTIIANYTSHIICQYCNTNYNNSSNNNSNNNNTSNNNSNTNYTPSSSITNIDDGIDTIVNLHPNNSYCFINNQILQLSTTKLKELKITGLLHEYQVIKEKCQYNNSNNGKNEDNDYESLHKLINQICDPIHITSELISIEDCLDYYIQVQNIHEQEISYYIIQREYMNREEGVDVMKDSISLHKAALVSQQYLFHLQQLAMILFDQFQLSLDYYKKIDLGKQVLQCLVNISMIVDMSDTINQVFIHHKRGIVFTTLSIYEQSQLNWNQSLDWEKVGISELASTLQYTLESHKDFAGYVLAYIHSASRLAMAYYNLHQLESAYEWIKIALNNINKLYRQEDSSNEERLMLKELISLHHNYARICTGLNLWDEYHQHIHQMDELKKYL